MEFIIVIEPSDTKLVERVNNYLAKGWKLYSVPYVKNHLTCQPMTKGEYVRPARLKVKVKKDETD